MSNPFQQGGAVAERQSRFAPLLINRFWSGQYSNSNPLSEPTVPYLYQKFYSGSRYETIRSGQNVEISPRLTVIRRPGISLYNAQTFTGVQTYYSFRVINPITGVVTIRVIVDTTTAVYDGTTGTKLLLWTKLPGAGQTSFRSVGNVLYAADGVSAWKWVWAPAWARGTTYTTGNVVIDSNNNLQKLTQIELQPAASQVYFYIQNNIGYIEFVSDPFTSSQLQNLPGSSVNLSGFTTATYFNGTSQTILTAVNLAGFGNSRISFTFSHGNVARTIDNGIVAATSGSGISGLIVPSWSTTIGATTNDNAIQWTNSGPSVEQWGINAPLLAPSVSNAFLAAGSAWAASTYYWPTPIIIDPNGNIQLLTTAGTTNSSVPSFNVSGTTTDGSATWTYQSSGTRVINTAYAIGSFIAVTVTTTTTATTASSRFVQTTTTTNYYFFTCTAAGTSSGTATANIVWSPTLGGVTGDGTAQWTNCGYQVKRSTASTSPSQNTQGVVGNSQVVAIGNSIIDSASSGGGSGFIQNVTVAGKSGASAPTWAVNSSSVEAAGLHTVESGGLTWVNGGPSGVANTGTWIYGFSFSNSITGHESSMSPASVAILEAANSGIAVGGNGDPNWATDGVDTINIYRSVQGFTTPFRLTSIPAPASGAPWSYLDVSPDPPNPASILNELIEADTVGNNAPAPAGLTNLTYYLNRIFASSGTDQYYSGVANQPVGVGAESFPGLNFMGMTEIISKSWPSPSGLLIFTHHGVFFSQGVDSNGNPNSPVQILEDVGLLSPNLFTVNGSIPVLLTADGQMLSLDPSSGVSRYGDPIADTANGMGGFSTVNSYLTWHVNGIDTAFYLADGSTGWFRLCPTAAPESGFTWSPKANIVGGCGAIMSVEVGPGVKQMLVYSPSNSQIFIRDLTEASDNNVPYPASFIIGSIVLAQPNQCAEVRSISTYAVATGSRPAVSVLGNEIAPTVSVPFAALANSWQIQGGNTISTPEPPFLAASTSLYADRWYFSTAAIPAWLQHLQLSFSWPAEAFHNELMGFALFGAVHVLSE